ncbi:MAG: methylmalonyl-CoA mutase family protein [Candidatus Syntropharchaeia archaeon]
MFSKETIEEAKKKEEEWKKKVSEVYEKKLNFKPRKYTTSSGIPLKYVYFPSDIENAEIDVPGEYPYTRGLRPLSYQYMPWMIQMLHGYGLPEETRKRTEKLMREGMAGYGGQPVFLVQLDMPTTFGYDPDTPEARGWVGVAGASIFTLEDIDALLRGFDLKKTRFAPNCRNTDIPMLSMYIAYAEGRGYKPGELNGQSQNRLKTTWMCSNVPCFRPKEQLKLQIELIKYTTLNMPRWNHTNLCGYILGESCASPVEELAFILAEVIELTEAGIEAGLNPDDFVPRFSTQMHMGMDFFEGIAKIRAARKMWAEIMKERFNCKNPRSLQFRIHVQTSGRSLTGQQPLNNIARTTLQVLACTLAGVQSIHTASYDEALGLPTEEAARTAMRINQIILHETNIPAVTDPLGGSYYVEWLTERVKEEAQKVLDEIERRGGFVKCMESGWFSSKLGEQMHRLYDEIEKKERIIVGVNKFTVEEEEKIPIFEINQEEVERRAIERIKKWKENRDKSKVESALDNVRKVAEKYESLDQAGNLLPAMIEAAKVKCTLGEMTRVLYDVYGMVFAF